ncbi:efflux RND transporter permease subunit [Roseomonas alkaliterrae]|uniref:Multidrug efflux pump subunit AcrB n=1 Tax=Neoroseomonas alkaliterrae TaxID=1452450 RepID=A0A840Y6P5_9PROT|nr:efflux RND transporter permease subunit [Neoroseomonas alkaliterrae]MBB5691621.1 multidrug efflux pump subunit AcrB [Neoroseomonas alkaliterrae]MBR0677566.1 efflux RND transporter permease subunit [Neoroseomonas alkaliterrae]
MSLGVSGRLAQAFIRSPLTPLLLVVSVAVGLIALLALPREEEPQISVPMVDIAVRADGLAAPDAMELVTRPLEAIVTAIPGVEHVYSQTRDDAVMVTARFLVGTNADDAILRVHERLRANWDRIPLGIPEPLVVGRGINDVAVAVVTLSPRDPAGGWDDAALHELADRLLSELATIPQVGLTYLAGGRPMELMIEPDPGALARHGITLNQLVEKLQGANASFHAGSLRMDGRSLPVQAGHTLRGVPDAGLLLLTSADGRPVYLGDVARISAAPAPREARVWRLTRDTEGGWSQAPAVSIAVAKRPGANAIEVTRAVHARIAALQGGLIPEGIRAEVTRDYGQTAQEKSDELLFHLGLATLSIVALVWLAIGWRAAAVTAVVIPVTILLTLFGALMLGYTLNRVSLFALIFSIGILVDDAIVVVENIDRHWAMKDGRDRVTAAIEAVAEVGNPTIVATLTVIVALLPMMFVSGMMGPYMAPIPAVASAAMAFSFFVAMVLTPWLMVKLGASHAAHEDGRLGRIYRAVAHAVIERRAVAWGFLAATGLATLASMLLFATRDVTVKLLPFDNKSELAVVLDMPAGTSLEATERALLAAAARLSAVPEVASATLNAGTAAPFNFNGLVRHSFLRASPELGDLDIQLTDRHHRTRESHAIALDVRRRLADLPLPEGARLRVVEVPPGPPVLATLLAEIYGPDAESRRAAAAMVREAFRRVPFLVDLDDSIADPGERIRIRLLPDQLEFHGVEEAAVHDTLRSLLRGVPVGWSHRGAGRNPLAIMVRLPKERLAVTQDLLVTPVPGRRGPVELGSLVEIRREPASPPIFRRNGRPAEMVMAELAGAYEAPIYGMLAVHDALAGMPGAPEIRLAGQPDNPTRPVLLWEGEWEVTRVTFRDMGAAFAVALLGIYVLVVAQFRSFTLPLVVLLPVPLALPGIVLGHWAMGAAFTAPSMIGFIALAGIIVRNSILLVDFIRHAPREGRSLRALALEAGAVRFKPIALTAAAAMIGAGFILADPIFQGLAVALLFGLLSSTLLTVLAIPAVYRVLRDPT